VIIWDYPPLEECMIELDFVKALASILSVEDRMELKFWAIISQAKEMISTETWDNDKIVRWQDFLSTKPLGVITAWIMSKNSPVDTINTINEINGSGNLLRDLCLQWHVG
jgi:hypothetical protein